MDALHIIGGCVGFLYAMTWAIWAVKIAIRMGKACLNKPKPEPKFPASVLMELMGDSRSPEVVVAAPRRSTPNIRYKKGSNSDDEEEVDIPLTRI